MLTIASSSIGVNAAENYVKYYLVNNKIIYNELEYE